MIVVSFEAPEGISIVREIERLPRRGEIVEAFNRRWHVANIINPTGRLPVVRLDRLAD